MACASAALFVALGGAPAFADPAPSGSAVPTSSNAPEAVPEIAPKGQPAEPGQPELQPDVELREPQFESRGYVEGEPLRVTLTIANMGPGEAKEVKAGFRSVSGAQFTFDDAQWGDLGTGVTLAPKETRELRVTGHFKEATGTGAQLEFSTTTVNDSDLADNKKVVSVPVVPPATKGSVAGTVYLDKYNNTIADAGEGAADVPVTINGPRVQDLTVRTDANGRFEAKDLPAGQYTVNAPRQLADGWLTQTATVVVNGERPNDNILIQAVRPLSAQLKATAKFNEGPYKPGDEATLRSP
ncbi:hypothetical protein KIPE111705_13725 [Kibdelosporangium persicum]|nr:hypothetical protein [Kibdelosporangium persicum]